MADGESQLPEIKGLPSSIEAPQQPDDLAIDEELHLNAGKHLKLVQRQLRTQLSRQCEQHVARIEKLEAKLDALDDVRVENARYRTADRLSKAIILICAGAIIVGGLMIETDEPVTEQVGYALAILGLAVQTTVSLFNPRVH